MLLHGGARMPTRALLTVMCFTLAVGACASAVGNDVSDSVDAHGDVTGAASAGLTTDTLTASERTQLAAGVRSQFAARGIVPITAPSIGGTQARRDALVALGQALVFDKILSDNHDVSCMTCHPPAVGGDDDRTLSMGVGGTGLGASRTGGRDIPRNAPSIFNLHLMKSLFWDGRVELLPDGTYRTPAGPQLTPAMTQVFELGALSTIGLFPVTNRDEMRDHAPDGRFDDLVNVADGDFTGTWNALMARLRAIPKYRQMFSDAYPSWPGTAATRIDTMTFAHASNAMAAFMAAKFVSKDSPWDNFVAGDNNAFRIVQEITSQSGPVITERSVFRGATRFLQTCANCHNGPLLSDGRFHNTALAQLGPGQGDGGTTDDFGRARVTGAGDPDARCGNTGTNASCRYAFRTTPLRNVLLTAPYGHAGEIGRFGNDPSFSVDVHNDLEDLRAFVAHYAVNPAENLRHYDVNQVDPRFRSTMIPTLDTIIANIDPLFTNGSPVTLADVDPITAFMAANTSLTLLGAGGTSGTSARFALCGVIPASVPSGLPLDVDDYDEDGCKADDKQNDSF